MAGSWISVDGCWVHVSGSQEISDEALRALVDLARAVADGQNAQQHNAQCATQNAGSDGESELRERE